MKKSLLVSLLSVCACGTASQPGSADSGPPRSAKYWFQHAYSLSSADIACTQDEECCVAIDSCNAAALIVPKKSLGTVQGDIEFASRLAKEPDSDSQCTRCIVPSIVARCVGGKCVGRPLRCSLACLGDAGVPDADTTGWCTSGEPHDPEYASKDHCGLEIPLPAGLTDDPSCAGGGGSGGSYKFGCGSF